MGKIAVFLANGFEQLEALTPVDVLKRAGATVHTISVGEQMITSTHNVKVIADYCINDVNLGEYDGFILPGGMPGAKNLSLNEKLVDGVKTALQSNKLVCAICASPAVVLAKHNLLDGYFATCYPAPDFIKTLGDKYKKVSVCVSKNLITANGPTSAMEFSLKICEYLGINPNF